ncbi:response regulator [Oharaeibacter diazotrophicus]|uniref:Two-component system chemotaxis response regulator CheY n=1 Tax=Oharaeibacter diazotrophicus TaxID=1920512 RepID=A0A4R6RI84_9HYPH|nr:response regulator [Oharaeibacter diazotrophicus]TDP86251.1 two-component system chemotaxis response regulator CheY [Oharaeibacter diazotrophicus]BBE71808.1 hypothetical protein OHA_1_01391 [Pleomorphomonas sp. SM30]GLS78573.1 hypothetical protein GCM10007904_39100 [Oharaeibacter diazotrophicus]
MTTSVFVALDQLRVAVVDDNAYFRRLVRTMLTGLGVRQVVEAATVEEGWQVATQQTPDVLLVDWNLSGQEGGTLLDRIRTHHDLGVATMAVVFVSAHTDKRHVLAAARLGANDFIVKPLSPRVLYERLKRLSTNRIEYVRVGGRLVPGRSAPGRAPAQPTADRRRKAGGGDPGVVFL